MASFEVQIYERTRWKIISIFDDKELAIYEAERAVASKRHGGVRVIQELQAPDNEVRIQVIFKNGGPENKVYTPPTEKPSDKDPAKAEKKTARKAGKQAKIPRQVETEVMQSGGSGMAIGSPPPLQKGIPKRANSTQIGGSQREKVIQQQKKKKQKELMIAVGAGFFASLIVIGGIVAAVLIL